MPIRKPENQENPQMIEARAERLTYLLRTAALPKKALSEMIGKTTRVIHAWETGRIPLSRLNAFNIIDSLKNQGVHCSLDWLMYGNGIEPFSKKTRFYEFKKNDTDIFDHFKLDFSISFLKNFYQEHYPHSLAYLIDDHSFSPHWNPVTLLIGVGMSQAKFKEDWPYGYLYPIDDHEIIPARVFKKAEEFWMKPYPRKGYEVKERKLMDEELIYPVITIRPLY